MPDFFGAQGIIAAQELQNANIVSRLAAQKSALDAQKTLGEIAAQPTDLAYKQSLTRSHMAQVEAQEAAAAEVKRSQQLQRDFLASRQEEQARKQLSDVAASQGKIATVSDLPPGGLLTQASQADDLEAFLKFSQGSLPLEEQTKLRNDIAEIKRKEAAAAASAASAGKNQYEKQVAQAKLIGNLAGAAGANEANYRAIMMGPQRQLLPRELTGNYGTDRPVLQAIEMASQDSIKRADAARELADSESKRRLDRARMGEASARVENLRQTGKTLKLTHDQLAKTGGPYSQEVLELKKAQVAQARARTEAITAENFPSAPLDVESRIFEQVYTARDGKTRATWQLNPATGKGVWVPLAPVAEDLTEEEE